jgi:hypothetical protein
MDDEQDRRWRRTLRDEWSGLRALADGRLAAGMDDEAE